MPGKSLGLIETVGLAAAVEAADAALKSANVTLAGCEQTKGNGLILVRLTGEVSAVNAAVEAGAAAASRMGKLYAHRVIARAAEGIGAMTQITCKSVAPTRPALPADTGAKTALHDDVTAKAVVPDDISNDVTAKAVMPDDTSMPVLPGNVTTKAVVPDVTLTQPVSPGDAPVQPRSEAETDPVNNGADINANEPSSDAISPVQDAVTKGNKSARRSGQRKK
ncbi:BMC domain-containing protein [Erwinia sp. BC051422]|uniref:BMC domain-containing protein n=1 Tax=Erwinia wuhanensis TaxID=3045167 RepID=UPI002655EE25|nr:BMC domain-containing protein [Erwinia sp. BC051422]MDN8541496.1 BMC domain-containing protein [Erwinia sp. BC051422]